MVALLTDKLSDMTVCRGRDKVVPVHALMAYKERRGKAPLGFNFDAIWGE